MHGLVKMVVYEILSVRAFINSNCDTNVRTGGIIFVYLGADDGSGVLK